MSIINFNLSSYMIEMNMKPHQILQHRIQQTITGCKMKHIHNLDEFVFLKNYITGFLVSCLRLTFEKPELQFNFCLGLQLYKYMDIKDMNRFNRLLIRIHNILKTSKALEKPLQLEFINEYLRIEKLVLDYINERIA